MFSYTFDPAIEANDKRFETGELIGIGQIVDAEGVIYYVVFEKATKSCMFYHKDGGVLTPLSKKSLFLAYTATFAGLGATAISNFVVPSLETVARTIVPNQIVDVAKTYAEENSLAAFNTALNYTDPDLSKEMQAVKKYESENMGIPEEFTMEDVKNIIQNESYIPNIKHWMETGEPKDECYIFINNMNIFPQKISKQLETMTELTFNVQAGQMWKCSLLQNELSQVVQTGGSIMKYINIEPGDMFKNVLKPIMSNITEYTSMNPAEMINTLVKKFDHTEHDLNPDLFPDDFSGKVISEGPLANNNVLLSSVPNKKGRFEIDTFQNQSLMRRGHDDYELPKARVTVEETTIRDGINETYKDTHYDTVARVVGILVGDERYDSEDFGAFDLLEKWSIGSLVQECWNEKVRTTEKHITTKKANVIKQNAVSTQATWEGLRSWIATPGYAATMEFNSVFQSISLWVSSMSTKNSNGAKEPTTIPSVRQTAMFSWVDDLSEWWTQQKSVSKNILTAEDVKAMSMLRLRLLSITRPFSYGTKVKNPFVQNTPDGPLASMCESFSHKISKMTDDFADEWDSYRQGRAAMIYARKKQSEYYDTTMGKVLMLEKMVSVLILSVTGLTIREVFRKIECTYRLFYEDAVLNPDCKTFAKKFLSIGGIMALGNVGLLKGGVSSEDSYLAKLYYGTTSKYVDNA